MYMYICTNVTAEYLSLNWDFSKCHCIPVDSILQKEQGNRLGEQFLRQTEQKVQQKLINSLSRIFFFCLSPGFGQQKNTFLFNNR